ncbi:hypothetical protein BSR03_05265 [Serratia proteamaculans]|nr:hypothetical protein E4343_13200 [Serratia quinivorans]RYM63579.1 hypothetical protein BSR03_05265 [Serratia proteamaculans]
MTKWSLNPRYPGLAHRGALRRASRYDPFGTLSLITGFVSCLKPPQGRLFALCGHEDQAGKAIRNLRSSPKPAGRL